MKQEEIFIRSTLDDSMQPSLLYCAGPSLKRPLLVGLHTWSFDRFNQIDNLLPFAEKHHFHLLLPEFRGPNLKSNPDCTKACGSIYAKQDIKDAIDHTIEKYNVDTDNIFMLGLSGGGHMALLMAGFCPDLFKAIGAFVPIADLKEWKEQNDYYKEHILACCGTSDKEIEGRSPIAYLETIAKSNLKIFHGKHDHVVPVRQSIQFYNRLSEKYPAASVYLDIFDGGHEIDMALAVHWILSQYGKNEKVEVTG